MPEYYLSGKHFKTNPQTPFLPGSGDTGQNRISNASTISLSVAYFKVWFCELSIICLFGVLFLPSVISFEPDQFPSGRLHSISEWARTGNYKDHLSGGMPMLGGEGVGARGRFDHETWQK
jgi:hypothetical protein